MKILLKHRLNLIILILLPVVINCNNDAEEYVWNCTDLAQTQWEGKIMINGEVEKITLSFNSIDEGYCYTNRSDNPECLFEYSIANRQINFFNIYGDSDKLLIDGLWSFQRSEKKEIKLVRIKSADHYDYLILSKK